MNFNLQLPINGLSFGQVSFGVLNELYARRLLPNIFPIGEIDIGAYDCITKGFSDWISFCISRSKSTYKSEDATITLWHINDYYNKHISKNKNILWTFHETDQLTTTEANIIKNTDLVLFSSKYALDIAEKSGLKNVGYCAPYFDSLHFKKDTNIRKVDAINFFLCGKIEKRKNTPRILQLWAKMYGNDSNYRLNCLINNPFISQENWNGLINQVFGGKIPWNINLIPRIEKNSQVSQILNASDIDLSGLSGAEGFNLPCFNMLALGKIGVVLDAHAHKDYLDSEQVIKVQPSGKVPIYDGAFFIEGQPCNQGNMYTWDDLDAEKAIREAEELFKSGKTFNSDLPTKFSVEKTVDTLLSYL